MATGGGAFQAVVLAAGLGRRFGGGKLLAPWGDGVLLDGALAAAFAAPVEQVLVVTGADAARVSAAAAAFAIGAGEEARLKLVHAPDFDEGMGASLRAGASAVPSTSAGVLVLLGDMPRTPHVVLEPLVAAVRAGAPAAAPAFEGRRGNPVALGPELFPALRSLGGDAGARSLLQGLGGRLVLIPSPDDGVLFDVDQPGDLRP